MSEALPAVRARMGFDSRGRDCRIIRPLTAFEHAILKGSRMSRELERIARWHFRLKTRTEVLQLAERLGAT
jgi:hypothetical protein